MNEYINPIYRPRLHDFGDDYHLPDVETDESLPMTKVKKIRRKYQNWFDYLDAVNLYDEYIDSLYAKYGGESKFRLAMLLGEVHEYIPNYPHIKKTRKNKYYRKNRIPRIIQEPIHFDPIPVEEIANLPHAKVKVRLVNDRKIDSLYDGYGNIEASLESTIGSISMLERYWVANNERIARMKGSKKKKQRLKRALERKTLKISLNYRSITDMIAMYDKEKRDKFFCNNKSSGNLVYYKGTYVPTDDEDHLSIVESLRSIGVVFSKLTKSRTKLIREKIERKMSKGKKRRKLDKKNRKKEDKFAREMSHGMFDDYVSFENEMRNMTGSRRFDKY
jgi:hypothetical protein